VEEETVRRTVGGEKRRRVRNLIGKFGVDLVFERVDSVFTKVLWVDDNEVGE